MPLFGSNLASAVTAPRSKPMQGFHKERIGIYPGPVYYFDNHSGTYRIVYESDRLPNPGTGIYAYKSLALAMTSVVGRATATPKLSVLPGQAMLAGQAIKLVGMPLVAGQIITQPLFNPQAATPPNSVNPASIDPAAGAY